MRSRDIGLLLKEKPVEPQIACHMSVMRLLIPRGPHEVKTQRAVASLMTYGQKIHEAGGSLSRRDVNCLGSLKWNRLANLEGI